MKLTMTQSKNNRFWIFNEMWQPTFLGR